ncbi:MAG: agmatinase [Thermodesulfobacteriota bacterium]
MFNFGGLTEDDTGEKEARFSVIPVPYDLTATYGAGARRGPHAIIEASTHMELYDEELGEEPYRAGIETLEPLEPTAAGPEGMIKAVRSVAGSVLETNKIPVILGGEHSITLGAVRAALERWPDLTVLQLDAHADMRESYQGTPFSHASVARRISEICPIVQAGIRSMSAEEAEFLKGAGSGPVTTYYAAMLMAGGAEKTAEGIIKNLSGNVYLTVDIDVLDPSIMPSTGTPEPGGLGWYEILKVLKKVISKKTVRGFDVVELAPLAGVAAPDFLAARLVYKIMAYINEGLKG